MIQQFHFWNFSKKIKMLIQKDTCTHMFIAALFETAKILKQVSINIRMDTEDVVCVCVFIHIYSDMKKNATSPLRQHGDLRGIILSETNLIKKGKYYMISLILGIQKMNKYNKRETDL